MVSIPHNAQTSSLEESDKLEATKELIEVEWRKMKETDDSVLSRQESLQSAFVVISNVITTTMIKRGVKKQSSLGTSSLYIDSDLNIIIRVQEVHKKCRKL